MIHAYFEPENNNAFYASGILNLRKTSTRSDRVADLWVMKFRLAIKRQMLAVSNTHSICWGNRTICARGGIFYYFFSPFVSFSFSVRNFSLIFFNYSQYAHIVSGVCRFSLHGYIILRNIFIVSEVQAMLSFG